MKTAILTILAIGVLLFIGCSRPTVSEPSIPADFTTYTDESGLFSISYPPNWELALSSLEAAEQAAKELATSIKSDAPVLNAALLFLAGVPVAAGYDPNVNITTQPSQGYTLEEGVEISVRQAKKIVEGYREFSRVKTRVDGKDVVILDCEGAFPGYDKNRYLQMVVLSGKVAWVVTCTASSDEFANYKEDFNAIVRSLLILQSSTTP